MKSVEVTINHKEGIHARPAAIFVKQSVRFQSEITLRVEETSVNGKSIMGILMLTLSPGTKVELKAEGPDEAEAIPILAEILSNA